MLVGGLPMLYPTGRGVLMYHLLNKMQPQPAPSAGGVLQRARSRAQSTERPDPGVYDLLVSLLHEGDSGAVRASADQGITIEAVEDPAAYDVLEERTVRRDRRAGCRRWESGGTRTPRWRSEWLGSWSRSMGGVGRRADGGESRTWISWRRSRENAVRRAEVGLRALLSALREPSNAVLLAAVQAGTTGGPREAWRAAVDAFAREHGLS